MEIIETLVDLLTDIDVSMLDGFALDHADVLSELRDFTVDDFELTQVSATRVAADLGSFSIALSGGQLSPAGSAEDLLITIDTAFADASMTTLQLSQGSLDLASFSLTEDGFILQSGNQMVQATAAWPSSLQEIFRLTSWLAGGQSLSEAGEETRQSLADTLSDLDVTKLLVRDGSEDVLLYERDEDAARLTSDATRLSVNEVQSGVAKIFLAEISGATVAPALSTQRDGARLDDLPYTVPELIEILGLDYTQAETDRVEQLADHTYISFSLDQSLLGTFDFDLRIVVDAYFADQIPLLVEGTTNADVLVGTAADELFDGRLGDDVIDGAGGMDAARFAGLSGHHSVVISNGRVTVENRIEPKNGIDVLTNVETLKFDDRFVELGDLDWVSNLRQDDTDSLTQLYLATLGRLPDASGMLFWLNAMADGLSIRDVVPYFEMQPDVALAQSQTVAAEGLVGTTYKALLGREADADGLAFWTDLLVTGDLPRVDFISTFVDGVLAQPDDTHDARYLSDLTDLGLYFALERGLDQTDTAAALFDLYAESGGSTEDVRTTIDILASEAASSLDALLISLPGFAGDFAL